MLKLLMNLFNFLYRILKKSAYYFYLSATMYPRMYETIESFNTFTVRDDCTYDQGLTLEKLIAARNMILGNEIENKDAIKEECPLISSKIPIPPRYPAPEKYGFIKRIMSKRRTK